MSSCIMKSPSLVVIINMRNNCYKVTKIIYDKVPIISLTYK